MPNGRQRREWATRVLAVLGYSLLCLIRKARSCRENTAHSVARPAVGAEKVGGRSAEKVGRLRPPKAEHLGARGDGILELAWHGVVCRGVALTHICVKWS